MLDLENIQFFTKNNDALFWGLIVLSIICLIGHIVFIKLFVESPDNADEYIICIFPFLLIATLFIGAFLYKTSDYAIVEVTEPKKCEELLNHQLNDKKFKREGNKLYFMYKIGSDEIKGRGSCEEPLTDNYLKEKIQNDFENEVFKVNFEKKKNIKFLGF